MQEQVQVVILMGEKLGKCFYSFFSGYTEVNENESVEPARQKESIQLLQWTWKRKSNNWLHHQNSLYYTQRALRCKVD